MLTLVILMISKVELFKSDDLSVNLHARLQFLGQVKIQKQTSYGFSIRRARTGLDGNFSVLKYKIDLRMEGSSISLNDFFVEWNLTDEFGVKVGQYKIPFNREELTSSGNLSLVDRSIANDYFNFARDIGLSFQGKHSLVSFTLGAFSGSGRNITKPDKNKNLLYNARIVLTPVGNVVYSQSALAESKSETNLNIGIAGLYTYISEDEKYIKRADKSKFMDNLTIPGSLYSGTTDVRLGMGLGLLGISFEAELILGRYDTSLTDYSFTGFRVQPGILIDKKIGADLRYSTKSITSDGKTKQLHQITLGPSYYFKKHNLKVQADYTAVFGENFNTENLFRTQFQIKF